MQQPGERLREVIDRLTHGNQREFAIKTGIIPPTINKIIKGTIPLTPHRVATICAAYPEISYDFLLRGEGPALVTDTKDDIGEENRKLKAQVAELTSKVELLERIIAKLVK